jgi:uncharacterized repeat protein (TIGR01451 family)
VIDATTWTDTVTLTNGLVPKSLATPPLTAGSYQFQASYSGDANYTGSTSALEPLNMGPGSSNTATVILDAKTNMAPDGALGEAVFDTATVTGSPFTPTGTVTYTLTGQLAGLTPPAGSGWTVVNATTWTDTVTLNANGTVPNSPLTPALPAGGYQFQASYSGDANYKSSTSALEPLTINQGSALTDSTILDAVTLGPPTGVAGESVVDTATVTGTPFTPTGTETYTFTGAQLAGLTPPAGWTKIDATTWTDTVTLSGGKVPNSLATPPLPAGSYQFQARYSGDANYKPATSAAEPLTVSAASLMISTTPSPSTAMLGATLEDVAGLTGGFDPIGSITFRLYAPGVDPTVGPATYTEIVGVNGDGTYHTTVGFASNATGIWHWVATYNGDPNNHSVSSGPLDEPVTIPPAADVTLTKLVSQTNPIFGTPVTYTLIAHNNGPDTATNVVATDIFPAGLVFVSATPSQGSFNPSSGQWIIGTLPNGATATLQITGIVAVIGPITNTSSVAASEFDPNLANNVSSVTIDGMFSAAQVSKRLFLSSNAAAVLAAEEALFNALVPLWVNFWETLLSVAQSMLAARSGPGNGGIAVFQGDWFGSPLVVYANPFVGQVTAVQVGTFDFLYENNTVASVRLI